MTMVSSRWARGLQGVQQAPDVVVYQLDHGVVGRLDLPASQLRGRQRRSGEAVHPGERPVGVDIGIPPQRIRQAVGTVAAQVLPRGIERRVGVEGIDAEQPRPVPLFPDEIDRPVGAPRRLVQFRGHGLRSCVEGPEVVPLLFQPVGVLVPLPPSGRWSRGSSEIRGSRRRPGVRCAPGRRRGGACRRGRSRMPASASSLGSSGAAPAQ